MGDNMKITDENWPKHANGRRKKIGEMTTREQIAVVNGAVERLAPEFAILAVTLKSGHD